MVSTRRKAEEESGTLTIRDTPVISWFLSLKADEQDTWVQQVVGRETAAVSGYTVDARLSELEIDYVYLRRPLEGPLDG